MSSSPSPTSSAPFFTNAPSSTSSPANDSSQDTSSLYLFTFLATLFLLLLISCGIILRSFVLRRRLRRSVEEALAAGVILPATFGGRRSRKDFGEKPTFYDAWVTPGGEKWEFIMPISVQITPNESLSEHTPNANTPTPTQSRNPFAQWRRQRSTPSSTAHTQTPSTPLNPNDPMPGTGEEEGDVQVSVLVAMPSPKSKPNPSGEEMEVVPEMVVGIAHLPYRTNPGATVSTSHPDGPGD